MAKIHTQDELLELLKQRVAQSNQVKVAAELGVAVSMVNEILSGRRDISRRFARAMGFESVYRKVA